MRLLSMVGVSLVLALACGGSTSDGGGQGGSGGSVGGSGGSGGSGATGGGAGTTGGSAGAGGSGAVYNWEACENPGECTLFATNCCGGYCSEEPISGFIPVNESSIGVVENQYCSGDVLCPGCPAIPHPNYVSVCRSKECTAVDIRSDAISACSGDDDCRLRFGSTCCESCGPLPGELIAVNKSGQLESEVCSPFAGACPPCVPPPYPKEAVAQCVGGHCQVVWATQPGG